MKWTLENFILYQNYNVTFSSADMVSNILIWWIFKETKKSFRLV